MLKMKIRGFFVFNLSRGNRNFLTRTECIFVPCFWELGVV